MTDNSTNRADISLPTETDRRAERMLQAELDSMAAEVPEMPESFRQGWREAVRGDAAAKGAARTEAATPGRNGKETGRKKEGSGVPWTRILGTAAAAAVLLGAVLTGRETALLTRQTEKAARIPGAAPAAEILSEATAQPAGMPGEKASLAAAGGLAAKRAESPEEEQAVLNSLAAAPMEDAFTADAAMFMEETADMEEAALEAPAEEDGGLGTETAGEGGTEAPEPTDAAAERNEAPETARARGGLWAGIGTMLLGLGLGAAALIRRRK